MKQKQQFLLWTIAITALLLSLLANFGSRLQNRKAAAFNWQLWADTQYCINHADWYHNDLQACYQDLQNTSKSFR